MPKHFRCDVSICVAAANPPLLTHMLFDAGHVDSTTSPINEFLERLEAINRLAPTPASFDPFQAQLVLLGVVAAVESYLRTVFRRLIVMDQTSQHSVHDEDVSFGAAMYLPKDLLPEAILERVAFVSKKAIEDALRNLLAIKGNLPAGLSTSIDDYVRICQLRHCAVHRFGKLGVKNAISLGLAEHKGLLEKPLRLDYVALQNAIAIATGVVKTLNNFLFNEILSRVPNEQWTGTYTVDRPLFLEFYRLFCDTVSAHRTPRPGLVYKEFRKQHAKWSRQAT